jgi:hypothetical protein
LGQLAAAPPVRLSDRYPLGKATFAGGAISDGLAPNVLKKSGLSEIGRLWRNNDSSGVGVLNH